MNVKFIQRILKDNPQLKAPIEDGQFLTGYTDGGESGEMMSVFLYRSPWSTNCIKATACGCVSAGEVLLVNKESKWSLPGSWKAYSPVV